MDSQEDASKQLRQQTHLSGETEEFFKNISSAFCENPFCLGETWHEWGCCSDKVTDFKLPVPDLPTQQILDEVRGCGLENECAGAVSTAKLSLAKRFAPPKTEEEIEKARIESIPKKTREDTAYCVRLWLSWSDYRTATTGIPVPSLAVLSATTADLQYWLIRFIHEIRKKNGLEYPPNTLHHIISGIMRHIRHDCGRPEVDFFKDPEFSDFRSSLDAEMKHLQSTGLGSEKKKTGRTTHFGGVTLGEDSR